MLPFTHRVAFLLFACACLGLGARGFYRLGRRIQAGGADTDARTDRPVRRIWYALRTTLTQSRTFRGRPIVSFLHSWIFYGFTFYLLVNAVDAIDGYYPLPIQSMGIVGKAYALSADVLSALVILAVASLILRRFALPSRKDFSFNPLTLLHEDVREGYIALDSVAVSVFILFHVGSRAVEMGSKLAMRGPDRSQPFATLLSHAFTAQHAEAWRIFGYWGALGSVLAFLVYFPYSKHIHIFMAPLKYLVARDAPSGVLPILKIDIDLETETLGAARLEELAWPRLLDAYACIQCNRCQDVCPATATGKSLSPSALEINKRMELNRLARQGTAFEAGGTSPRPLLEFALTPEAAWACTTCGACMQVCPVQDEPMLDIIDIRRQQVMMEGRFPAQLQTAFRGMERAKNPWGIAQESRLAWANGLNVRTIEQNPDAEVLYWVGCAASYDPQAQKTARALVQILEHAGVNYAVLGKKECCTGDSARRAGNEVLYQQLAEQNIRTLDEVAPKLIVATCPHCMNALGKEYAQLGGNFAVMHHTEYLDLLTQQGRLSASVGDKAVTFHDPCYLGRHNDVYDAPRNLLHILSNDVRELGRSREKSFCCGAGGAQFWKEEEAGTEKISENRLREAEHVLAAGAADKVLAVGCPFCKSMLQSSARTDGPTSVAVMDVAELLWENISRGRALSPAVATSSIIEIPTPSSILTTQQLQPSSAEPSHKVLSVSVAASTIEEVTPVTAKRKKWVPTKPKEFPPAAVNIALPSAAPAEPPKATSSAENVPALAPTQRKKWPGKPKTEVEAATAEAEIAICPSEPVFAPTFLQVSPAASLQTAEPAPLAVRTERQKWPGKSKADEPATTPVTSPVRASGATNPLPETITSVKSSGEDSTPIPPASKRRKWPAQRKSDV